MNKQLVLTTVKDGWYTHKVFDAFLHSFSSSYTIKGYSKPTKDILDIELPCSVNTKLIIYAWLVDHYLITLNNTVTLKVFTKEGDSWLSSNLNNANFLYIVWMSLWKVEWLGDYWWGYVSGFNGSCDWDLTDTPITVDKLFKAFYEYTDWVVELNKDRQAGDWEVVNE